MGKYYWLKLPRDFFKRHDMIILESMDNGWIYEMIFVKLLAESIDHDGELRFSASIPYDSKMLASICRTDEETMKAALSIFQSLGLIHIDKKKTLSITIASKMIGSAEDNDAANRQRRCRARKIENDSSCDTDVTECHKDVTEKRDIDVTKCHTDVTQKRDTDVTKDYESKSKSKSKSKRIEKEEKENNKLFSSSLSGERPSKDELISFCQANNITNVDLNLFFNYYSEQNWMIDGEPIKSWKALLIRWSNSSSGTWSKKDDIKTMNEWTDEDWERYNIEEDQKSIDFLNMLLKED